MHTMNLVTEDGATREFVLGSPQKDEDGNWFLRVWEVDDD